MILLDAAPSAIDQRDRMRTIERRIAMVLAATLPCMAACGRRDAMPLDAGAAVAPIESASISMGRCAIDGAPVSIGGSGRASLNNDAPVPFGAEVGSALADAHGFVVGVRVTGREGAATLVHVRNATLHSVGDVVVSTLATGADTRPPRPFLASNGALFASVMTTYPDRRSAYIYSTVDAAATRLIGVVDQQADESEATSAIVAPNGIAVAWDEADPTGTRGIVRLRVGMPIDAHVVPIASSAPSVSASAQKAKVAPSAEPSALVALPPDVVSPVTSDANAPMLIPLHDGGRAVLLWLAERVDLSDGESVDGGAGEPSQQEAARWVEAVVVDLATGHAIGAPRALTAAKGHAQTFAAAIAHGDGDPLIVAWRDDARPTDGDGGSIAAVRVPIGADGALGESIRAAVASGTGIETVAPGLPRLVVRGAGAWVAYLDGSDDAHLVPVFLPTGALGAPSLEPSLHGRAVAAATADGTTLLGVRVVGDAVELAILRCHD